jgi:hypothetical protein
VLKMFILLMMTPNSPTLKDRYDLWGRCFRDVGVAAVCAVYGSVVEG